MAIEYLSKKRAKLVVSVGSASKGTRRRYTKIIDITGKKNAKDQYDDFVKEVKDLAGDVGTVADLLDEYIEMQRLKGLKETTLTGYKSYAKRLKSRFKGLNARDLTPYQIEKFITSAMKGDPKAGYPKKSSPKTIKGYISLLSSAYKMAVRSKALSYNPCDSVEIPKQKKPDITVLTKEDLPAFISALEDTTPDLKVCFELALFCGLRRSEILGLKNEDFNLTWKTVSITRTRHRKDRQDIIQDTKTERSRRIVAVPEFVMDDVVALIKLHEEDPYIENPFLIQYAAEPMRPDYAKRAIKDFTREHDLPDVTLHGLRHSYATMLNASGQFDIAEISAALGHSTIGTTLNIYTHLWDSSTNASRRIADYLQKGHQKGTSENEKPLKR